MKIFLHAKRGNRGSILFLTLILTIIMGIALGSYLILASGQQKSVARSQRWNSALDVAEAGIEEGLAQVNYSPHDFSVNGWTAGSGTYGPQQRTLVNGSYSVLVVGSSTPTIYATGTVTAPITGDVIKRAVRVTTQVLPLFNVALGAVGNINMNGNGMATDSWNSHDTNLSVNGAYSSSKISTNGDVASVDGIVNIGNHTINGALYLGPAASYSSGTNQVTGDIDKNYNVNFPDATLPAGAASAIPPTNSLGTNYLSLDNTIYTTSSAQPIVVKAGLTNVTLIVTAMNFSPNSITLLGGMTNPPYLTIYDSPPSSGGSVSLGGNSAGGAINATPLSFVFYGLPNLTGITLSGNSAFIGAIYAPEAVLTLNGGGNSSNLQGAAIVKSITMNGHYDFHYDEALAKFGPAKGFIANSWQEL